MQQSSLRGRSLGREGNGRRVLRWKGEREALNTRHRRYRGMEASMIAEVRRRMHREGCIVWLV